MTEKDTSKAEIYKVISTHRERESNSEQDIRKWTGVKSILVADEYLAV
jgi:hypothetical protein